MNVDLLITPDGCCFYHENVQILSVHPSVCPSVTPTKPVVMSTGLLTVTTESQRDVSTGLMTAIYGARDINCRTR